LFFVFYGVSAVSQISEQIIGRSPAMRRIFRQIGKAAKYDVPVLIVGETGTGKDLVAREIHRASARADSLFNPINMGAIPHELIASTLFGHEKGAFTGATSQKAGMFEATDGGTLFLDEVGTMDEQTQISLLRVLEDRTYTRVGGTNVRTCDVRVIAATNVNIREEVKKGHFRSDLFYRLNVFTIQLPPLKRRGGDIMLLAHHFLEKYAREFDKTVNAYTKEAQQLLSEYLWPGNVRELENVIIQAIISTERSEITPGYLKQSVHNVPTLENHEPEESMSLESGITLEEAEKELIKRTLDSVNGRRSDAARILGISRKGFYNKLKKHDLQAYMK
jgi:DNA-binding NtrC family response regulator